MSDVEITMEAGSKKRLLTAGKYCDKNILVTATGGGSASIPTPPDDGKTRLYITIQPSSMEGQPPPLNNPTLYFTQTVSGGVTIDWGDGSALETVEEDLNGEAVISHVYTEVGDYVISMEVADGCELGLGISNFAGILGDTPSCLLLHAFIGAGVTTIGTMSFVGCTSLLSVKIPKGITCIYVAAFSSCVSLSSVTIPESVIEIWNAAFSYTMFAKSFYILPTNPPKLASENAFEGIPEDCVFYVPAQSVDAYKTAENWSAYADRIQALPT